MITYNSDSDSNNDSNSSYEDELNLNPSRKQTLTNKNQLKHKKRLKSAIAFRFCDFKDQKKVRNTFNAWKDHTMVVYRSQTFESLHHYQRKLIEKGFDGLVEYATNTGNFKQKLVIFYYHYLLSKCFFGWASLDKTDFKQDVQSIYSTRQNIHIYNDKNTHIPYNQHLKVHQLDCQHQFRIQTLKLGFHSIRSFVLSLARPSLRLQGREQQRITDTRSLQYSATVTSQQRNTGYRSSANQLLNSRNTLLSNYQDLTIQKSRRKLTPIVEQVQLPVFPMKPHNEQQQSQNQIIMNKLNLVENVVIRSEQRSEALQIKSEMQLKLKSEQAKQQQIILNNEKIEIQKKKALQSKRERVLGIMAKGKIMELSLLQQNQSQQILIFKRMSQQSRRCLQKLMTIK